MSNTDSNQWVEIKPFMDVNREIISSIFSSDSEAFASESLENIEESVLTS